MKHLTCLLYLISLRPMFGVDSLPVGTWVRRDAKEPVHLTLKIEPAGSGLKLTYTMVSARAPAGQVLTVVTQLDGKDAPTILDGKPTGGTMAVRAVDSRHATAVIRYQGQQMNTTSQSEVSPDGKVLKVEVTTMGADGKPSIRVEYWDKK